MFQLPPTLHFQNTPIFLKNDFIGDLNVFQTCIRERNPTKDDNFSFGGFFLLKNYRKHGYFQVPIHNTRTVPEAIF